jgi:DNA recombination protein RmuC
LTERNFRYILCFQQFVFLITTIWRAKLNILWFFIGLVAGGVLVWLIMRTRVAVIKTELETKSKDAENIKKSLVEAMPDVLNNANATLVQMANQTLSTHITKAQGELDLRKQAVESMVKPIKETLEKIEKERLSAYSGFKTMTDSLVKSEETLAKETRHLSNALRTPWVRGRWGETTLRRVVELVGMVEHCDFTEQTTIEKDDVTQRPDMIIHLPNHRQVVVDSKAPLEAYIQAEEADTEETKVAALDRHAKAVRNHCDKLAAKSYWASLDNATELVVVFLPGEPWLAAALQRDKTLLEDEMSKRVVLTTPSSLKCPSYRGVGYRDT